MKSEKKTLLRLVLQLMIGCAAAGGFVLLNVNGGPLVLMDYIGGWTMRSAYLVLCGMAVFAAFAVLTLQKRDWMTYAVTAIALFLGALMRFYMIDMLTPYYSEGLAPFMRALENGLSGLIESDYTPAMSLVLWAYGKTGIYPMYVVKWLSISCDLIIALLLGALIDDKRLAKVAAVAYLFCPVFFLYSAYAGTPDALYVMLVLISAVLLKKEQRMLAWAFYGEAVALDPMALAALPVLLLWKGKRRDWNMLFAPVTGAAVSLPAVLLGMPVRGAMHALLLGGRNAQVMQMRSSSIYNFFAPVFVKDMPEYHIMRYVDGVEGSALIHEMFTLENLLTMRSGFMMVFAVLFAALMVLIYRYRKPLQACRDALYALLPLVFCMFLPSVDAACFVLADIGMLMYALRVRGGWKIAALSLGASAVSAVAFVTSAELVPLWMCMAAQLGAMLLLARDVLGALRKANMLGQANAPERI